jgi:Beta-propeller repeat
MSRQGFRISTVLCMFLGLSVVASAARPPLPVAFEAHQGPADPQVRFTARSQGASLALMDDGGALLSRLGADGARHAVRLFLEGARPCPAAEGEGERGTSNYFRGNDPAQWRTGIPTWDRVRYDGVWPGIDLVYYATQGQFEHDFIVAPGADPGAITLRFEGVDAKTGALDTTVDGEGNLQLAGSGLTLQAPRIYQELGGTRQQVTGHYVPAGPGRTRIAVDAYDLEKPLVIDPVIVFSSFLGGSDEDVVSEVTVDSAGNTYVAGGTVSDDFPTVNPAFSTHQGFDIIMAKISADGSHLIYSTYLGSSENDRGLGGIAVDAAGDAYISGWVSAPDFPVLNALQPTLRGLSDLYVAKLNPTGALAYSTYLGGSSYEYAPPGATIKVRPDGTAYITGASSSADFPQVHAIQTGLAPNAGCLFLGLPDYPDSCLDVTLTVISPNGDQILYSTLWGGPGDDVPQAIAIDPSGAAYILGSTSSPGFPLVNPFQSQLKGGADLFVMKIRPDGTPPVYATLLGGNGNDDPREVRVDAEGNAYVFTQTASTDLPVKNANAVQPTYGGGPDDWYLAKINPRGTGLDYATYFGGPGFESAQTMGVDALGNVAMSGFEVSYPTDLSFPTLRPLTSATHDDGFVVKVHATGPTLLYSTPVGGGISVGLDIDSRGDVHVGGGADNSGSILEYPPTNGPFPLVHSFQTYAGGGDGFVMRIADGFATLATPSRIPAQPGGTVTVPVNFTPGGANIAFTAFSIDYDETCLTFDPTDANGDGIPDAITFTLPAGFGKTVMFNPADTSGEIDISIFDPSPPFALLPLSALARITFHVKPTCGAAAVSTLAKVGFSSTPAVSFGDTSGQSSPGISLDGSVQVWGGLHGDCNGDGAVNAGDLGASVLEMFDGDGSFWLDAPLGTFAGSPAGCDANADQAIDAGDLSCTILLIFQGQGACAPASPRGVSEPPSLTLPASPSTSADGSVVVPVQFRQGTAAINTMVFSLIIPAGLVFDPTDANHDGIPDAVTFRLPAGFSGSVQWTPSNRAGQLAILVMDTSGRGKPLPSVTNVAVVNLKKKIVKGGADTVLRFGTAPAASFGNTQGSSTLGLVVDGSPDKGR